MQERAGLIEKRKPGVVGVGVDAVELDAVNGAVPQQLKLELSYVQ